MQIILFGQAPLPLGNSPRTTAPGYRTWHFRQALIAAGHNVHLLAMTGAAEQSAVAEPLFENEQIYYCDEQQLAQGDFLPKLLAEIKPDAAVGANIWPSYLAALYLPPGLPLWVDMFGSPLAEAQAKAVVYNDDGVIAPFARFEQTVLARADKFSAVANRQKYAIVGELAMAGRLSRATYGYQFAHTIPAALDEAVLPHTKTVLRGKLVPEDALVVLWSGGYNTWTDVDTLFAALEAAMKQNSKLCFVSTGGALPPHDSQTYPYFEALVAQSPYRQRYHLLGWQPLDEVHNYYYESNAGIILDKWSYEGELGSRTRILEWLKYGLLPITTNSAELTDDLAKVGAVFTFEHGNSSQLANVLLDLAANQQKAKQAAAIGRAYVNEHYHYKVACADLVRWAAKPQNAPDVGQVPAFNLVAGDMSLERELQRYQAHLAEKNAQIAGLEKWALEMQAALQQQTSPLTRLTKLATKFFGKK